MVLTCIVILVDIITVVVKRFTNQVDHSVNKYFEASSVVG